jgi:hypothetical protein
MLTWRLQCRMQFKNFDDMLANSDKPVRPHIREKDRGRYRHRHNKSVCLCVCLCVLVVCVCVRKLATPIHTNKLANAQTQIFLSNFVCVCVHAYAQLQAFL